MDNHKNVLLKFILGVSIGINFLFIFTYKGESIKPNFSYIFKNDCKDSPNKPELQPQTQSQLQPKLTRSELRDLFLNKTKFLTRDYFYYECKDRRRIGGLNKPADSPLSRIDGAWYVCFDSTLAPVKDNCNVLSFGINTDESFDFEINRDYGCQVHSFDPFIEANRFTQIRNSNPNLANAYEITVNSKWKFYRIGVTGSASKVANKGKIGWIETLENIIEMTNFKNKVIDIFKMDIESGEIDVLKNLNVTYACKYFKQFVLETHSPGLIDNLYELMKVFDKCFSLFYRDSRLIGPHYNGEVVKDVAKSGFNINLNLFQNENNLANFLFSTGELYFINENFLDSSS